MSKDEYYRPFEYLGDDGSDHRYKCKACSKKFETNLDQVDPKNTVLVDGRVQLKCPGCGVT